MEFTEIEETIFRPGADQGENHCPKIPFDSLLNGDLDEAALQVNFALSKVQYAEKTVESFVYGARRYYSFLRDMDTKYRDFITYQPTPFPIQKQTLLMYLYWLKVEKNYAHSTIQTLCYGFLNYVHQKGWDRNLAVEYKNDIKKAMKALLRKFGNKPFKVDPLMNPDLRKLRLMCDQCTESGSKLNVLLAQGRARGLRADTFQHVELRHLTWRKTVVNDRFRLCVDMEIVKDKTVLQEDWKQNNPGWVNISMCPI